jgi:uncharacterized protein (TIGR03663 family)
MNRARVCVAAAILAILAVAAAIRLPRLAQRPMHADEANQAVKSGRLFEKGEYEYDATDHHGPSLYWLTLPSLAISGAKDLAGSDEAEYRIVPAIFGLALIPLIWLLADGLGRGAVLAAALLTAISPAMVFYSRYYIQETLLVFFMLAVLGCGWRYYRRPRMVWVLGAGASLGMMHATKETWVLAAAAAIVATGLTWAWSKLRDRAFTCPIGECGGAWTLRSRWRLLVHVLLGVFAAVLVAGALFSMFGKNWDGPWNSITAYANYARRGSEQGKHSAPWYYYLQTLFAFRPARGVLWSEGFIAVLALIGGVSTLAYRQSGEKTGPTVSVAVAALTLPRFLTFFTVVLTLLYSLISYKTPWCALSFLMGLILLAGVGTAAIFRWLPGWPAKTVATLVLAAGGGQLGWQAYQLNFSPRFLADPKNPYIYSHTPTTLPRLLAGLDRLADRVPEGHDLWIQIVAAENYWPIPWYLRRFNEERIGYWLDAKRWKQETIHLPPPAIMIVSGDVEDDDMANRLAGYNSVYVSLRPGILATVYIQERLWPEYLLAISETAGR